MFSSADLSLAAGKMRKNSLITGCIPVNIRRFRVFEAGYWKYSQNKLVISKEQAKTLSLNFFINYESKNSINHMYQRLYRKYLIIIIRLQKNIHLVTQSL